MMEESTLNVFVTIFCLITVVLNAVWRYNHQTNHLLTTSSLFLVSCAGYTIVWIICFFFLGEIILMPGAFTVLGLDDVKTAFAHYTAPPITAAIMTILLANVTPLGSWLLGRFQALGRVPLTAQNLKYEVMQSQFSSEIDISQLNVWMSSVGHIPAELLLGISADSASTLRESLSRVFQLWRVIEELSGIPEYEAIFKVRMDEWWSIKEDLIVYITASQSFFVIFDKIKLLEGLTGEIARGRTINTYEEISKRQSERLADFLARLLLAVERSQKRIASRLSVLGLRHAIGPPGLVESEC